MVVGVVIGRRCGCSFLCKLCGEELQVVVEMCPVGANVGAEELL